MYIVISSKLAQYLREILYDETVASEWHSIRFYESLKEVVLEWDMDIIVKFLNNLLNQVQVGF